MSACTHLRTVLTSLITVLEDVFVMVGIYLLVAEEQQSVVGVASQANNYFLTVSFIYSSSTNI